MQTKFSQKSLTSPAMALSERIIRSCVHCGFCTATCPTYVMLGDELDSPRGRIYLIKEMLENERAPSDEDVKHLDRCLSCLSCMTTCPSGVDYMHLVDHARNYIQHHYDRPLIDKLYRGLLAQILPFEGRFRAALSLARPFKKLVNVLPRVPAIKPLSAMLSLAPPKLSKRKEHPNPPVIQLKGRVALLRGCAEPVLRPQAQEATTRLLARMGFETIHTDETGCCGALTHHLGREEESLQFVRRNVDAWWSEIDTSGLAAIVVTASGCGTTVKDYGHLLQYDPSYAEKAKKISSLAMDITEFVERHGIPLVRKNHTSVKVAYHSACSLQHGQKITQAPIDLLEEAGFEVTTPDEPHLCCGSAGTYNILQSELAQKLGERKAANFNLLEADVIAAGNIGCATQLERYCHTPIVHTVELLDWATGGPKPDAINHL